MSVIDVTFPGNISQVATKGGLRALPSSYFENGELYLVDSPSLIVRWDASSVVPDDGATTFKPADISALQAGRWIAAFGADGNVGIKGDPGDDGPAGPPGYRAFATWASLNATTGTFADQAGQVEGLDAGTHTDPVVGGTVPNAGRYAWSTSPAGWRRVADLTLEQTFATRSALKSGAVTGFGKAYLTEGVPLASGRFGTFIWDSARPYADAAYDPQEGWLLFPTVGVAGAWVRDGREGVSAAHAGVVIGTGLTAPQRANNRAAIQGAVDIVTYNKQRAGQPTLPSGLIEYSGTIHMGYGDKVHTTYLSGQGPLLYSDSSIGGGGTGLIHICTAFDVPAFNFQAGRKGCGLGNFTLKGGMFDIYQTFIGSKLTYTTGAGDPTFILRATWAALGGDGRYNPYAGIAVDAYCGTQPATHYPNVSYPSFTGKVTQYGVAAVTSAPKFEDIEIVGFNTAFVNKPSDAGGNADFPEFERCQFSYCMYGWSIGEGQCRNFATINCQWALLYVCFTNSQHGRRDGQFGGVHTDSSGGSSVFVFDFIDSSVLNNPEFKNLYTEAMYALGPLAGNTAVEGAITFTGGTIDLSLQAVYGPSAQALTGGSTAHVLFDGTRFTGHLLFFNTNMPNVEFRGDCVFSPYLGDYTSADLPQYKRFAYNATAGGALTTPSKQGRRQSIRFRPVKISTGDFATSVSIGESYPPDYWGRDYCLPMHQWSLGAPQIPNSSFQGERRRVRPTHQNYDLASSFASTPTLVGRTLTMVLNLLGTESVFTGGLPGDMVVHEATGTIFIVKSRTTVTVVAEQQTNYRCSDNAAWDTITLTSGGIYFINCRQYSLLYETTGDVATGSAIVTNVMRADLDAGHISEITVGDGLNAYFDTGAFGPTSGIVTATDVGAKTVTMTANGARALPGCVVNDWSRKPIANVP